MMRRGLVISLLALSACVADPAPMETEGGIIETTDEMSIADTGFPNDAILMTRSKTLEDGTTLRAVQYYDAAATPKMISAAPAALCASQVLTLVSSRSFPANADYIDTPDTSVTEAICK